MDKLNRRLGGIKGMDRLPSLVFITDMKREQIAVKEANKLGIPILAMVDTNCDPTPIDLVIPANDDAIRSIKLIANKLADAVVEGQHIRAALLAEEEEEMLESAAEWDEHEYEEEEEVGVGAEEFAQDGDTPVAEKEHVGTEDVGDSEATSNEGGADQNMESEIGEQTGEEG